jgi:hypothetical protein
MPTTRRCINELRLPKRQRPYGKGSQIARRSPAALAGAAGEDSDLQKHRERVAAALIVRRLR